MRDKNVEKPFSEEFQARLAAAQARARSNYAKVAPWLMGKRPAGEKVVGEKSAGEKPAGESSRPKKKKKVKLVRRDLSKENRAPPTPTPNHDEVPSSLPEGTAPRDVVDFLLADTEATRLHNEGPPSASGAAPPVTGAAMPNSQADRADLAPDLAIPAGGVISESSAPASGSQLSAREGISVPPLGETETPKRRTFCLGRGKPLHLLFGKSSEGQPGPSRQPSGEGIHRSSEPKEQEAEGEEDEDEEEEEEREDSPLPSASEMEDFLEASGSGKARRQRIAGVLSKLARQQRANSAAVRRIHEMMERRLAIVERDCAYLLGGAESQDTLSADTSPGRHIARIRDQLRLANQGLTTLTAFLDPRVPPKSGRRELGRWRWVSY
ncbi:hypothetical protein KSP40_PGU010928 [Platanthera guangdongensis]|uniref:Uncharacterized protein n=1 Tax=Platanthera guangdongensis TaxID=2320717 RepID=A0ABR2LH49_9ASPA